MILAILITVFALGAAWVYLIPTLQSGATGFLPSGFASNKWVQIVLVGAFLLITVWIVGFVVKAVGVKAVASA